ncbi:MAG: hypothetical protein IJM59_01415, partial [Proteobacteria bacterium]|nr:hypothetical protein [Pseudomonadota bacterium]
MKKLAFLLMAAAMCGTLGCDTDISNEEISDVLTPETRCLMTGGIPLTSAQVEQVRQTLNNPEAYFDYEKKPLDISSGMNIVNVYRSTYQYSAANPQNDSDFYCACGADICDKGVGCTQSSGYATCSAVSLNTDINAECDPVKVDNRYFGYLLSSHLFPILRQVAGLRSMQSSQDGLTKVSKLLKSPELQNNLLSKDNKGKKKLTTYLANLLSESNPTGEKCEDECADACEDECADAMVASLFYASIAECMNNKTDHCPDGMQLTVEGADSSQSKSET